MTLPDIPREAKLSSIENPWVNKNSSKMKMNPYPLSRLYVKVALFFPAKLSLTLSQVRTVHCASDLISIIGFILLFFLFFFIGHN